MDRPSRRTYLALILVQAVHSVEEYVFRLYDVLAPARAVSEALGLDRAAGFVIFNVALFLLGLGCWVVWIRRARFPARAIAWAWALIETLNGVAHMVLAIGAGGYFPGLATAPLLLAAGGTLCLQLARSARPPRS